jgi:hypothetical protein
MATVTLYTPDTSPKQRQTPEATPTRSSADGSSLTDSLKTLSIRTPLAPFMSSNPLNASAYNIPGSCGSAVVGGHVYNPYSPNQISPGSQQQFGVNLFSSINNNPLTQSSRDGIQYFPSVYGSLGNPYPPNPYWSPPHSGQSAQVRQYYGRPSPNRENREVVRRGYQGHNSRYSGNHATGPHNHVDINKIQAGSDVRTTVSFLIP